MLEWNSFIVGQPKIYQYKRWCQQILSCKWVSIMNSSVNCYKDHYLSAYLQISVAAYLPDRSVHYRAAFCLLLNGNLLTMLSWYYMHSGVCSKFKHQLFVFKREKLMLWFLVLGLYCVWHLRIWWHFVFLIVLKIMFSDLM